jgi:hypothetical protein
MIPLLVRKGPGQLAVAVMRREAPERPRRFYEVILFEGAGRQVAEPRRR